MRSRSSPSLIVGGTEVLLRAFKVRGYIMPTPSPWSPGALVSDFHLLAPHLRVTLAGDV